jgi:hypothetical protein
LFIRTDQLGGRKERFVRLEIFGVGISSTWTVKGWIQILVRKPEGKRHRWEDNIRMDPRGSEYVDRKNLVQDKDQ